MSYRTWADLEEGEVALHTYYDDDGPCVTPYRRLSEVTQYETVAVVRLGQTTPEFLRAEDEAKPLPENPVDRFMLGEIHRSLHPRDGLLYKDAGVGKVIFYAHDDDADPTVILRIEPSGATYVEHSTPEESSSLGPGLPSLWASW